MKRWLIALGLLSFFSCAASAEETRADGAIRVHGRLSLYNGNPGFRIWVVGTKRVLGVAESPPEQPLMPAALVELVRNSFVFGDFTVIPLTKDEPGIMRMVRVIRVERFVVTDGNLQVVRQIHTPIENEANNVPEPAPAVTSPARQEPRRP